MDRYDIGAELGRGAFGTVSLARRKDGRKVAIKAMTQRYSDWSACLKLREVRSLQAFGAHPRIVALLEVVREREILSLVFEYMPTNLHLFLVEEVARAESSSTWNNPNAPSAKEEDQRAPPLLGAQTCRDIVIQILQGLAFMHGVGFFHRDIKPENLLVRRLSNGVLVVKLADFGLAREIRSQPPYTEYVATRWYRAPELLLQVPRYSSPVDVFATGCIWSELLALRPLFPGASHIDMVQRQWKILGSPNDRNSQWAEGTRGAVGLGLKLAKSVAPEDCVDVHAALRRAVPSADGGDIVILASMLALNPRKRFSAQQAAAALRSVDPGAFAAAEAARVAVAAREAAESEAEVVAAAVVEKKEAAAVQRPGSASPVDAAPFTLLAPAAATKVEELSASMDLDHFDSLLDVLPVSPRHSPPHSPRAPQAGLDRLTTEQIDALRKGLRTGGKLSTSAKLSTSLQKVCFGNFHSLQILEIFIDFCSFLLLLFSSSSSRYRSVRATAFPRGLRCASCGGKRTS